MMRQTIALVFAAALLAACASTPTPATRSSGSFADFVAATHAATADAYVGREGFAVANAPELGRMQAHLTTLYEGVTSSQTVRDAAGTTFDCIPVGQQPGLRGGKPLLTPRNPTLTFNNTAGDAAPRGAEVRPNSVGCGAGTVPMRRITLEQMARFRTLEEFLTGNKRYPLAEATANFGIHYYATAYETVPAYGAGTDINIWQPAVPATDAMSISQLWVAGGSGAARQTAEAGWSVYPIKFGTISPVLFEFWTPNNYVYGCYNLECPGFVQTNPAWALGGVVGPISQPGGAQSTLQYTWWRDSLDGAWWLYLGHGSLQAVGYIAKAWYGTGQMSINATDVMFGGETGINVNGVPAGEMGSGAFANAGYSYAAFQTKLTYYPTSGGILPIKATILEPTPQCYTVTATSGMEITYMYFGGPHCP